MLQETADARIVDLSTPIEERMAVYSSIPDPEIERVLTAAADGVTSHHLTISTHIGTHIDAPAHIIPGGKMIDDYPISKFMGRGIALDMSYLDPLTEITREDLEAFDDEIEDGDVVMCHTGWSNKRDITDEYLFEYPYFDESAGLYFQERNAKAVGIDSLSVGGFDESVPNQDATAKTPTEVSHMRLLEDDIIPIEVVNNLDDLLAGADSQRAFFFYPPLNVAHVEGGPARAVAIVEN
ncbi:cyclase family protein [Natrarchaeobius chitinivorans]|uniref:Cyclase family protein n=1 Tax=Natrarchaeobius chitinivorans TaxID=1679083 RepID=A0A3N6P6Z8_NATCH|nr:cyclase family protein [Natrarchaeobius chitinivorans]RQG94189.1 cyclase family protein [Natrarchaeobius chitinivorans]